MTKYAEMGTEIGRLTQEKNEAYGASFEKAGEVLGILYPNGVEPEQFRDALAVVRVIDKLFRIATRKDAFGESPWRDIAGYAVLGAVADDEEVYAEYGASAQYEPDDAPTELPPPYEVEPDDDKAPV